GGAVGLASPRPRLGAAANAHSLQLARAVAAKRSGAFRKPARRPVRGRVLLLHRLAAAAAADHQRCRRGQREMPHCFPPPCTRKAGSIPRSRITASQILSTGVSKMRLEEMLE